MKKEIKGGEIKCLLDVYGVCPHCFKLIGDVYKIKNDGTQTLMKKGCKYQHIAVEITAQEIKNLPKMNCGTGKCKKIPEFKQVTFA